MIWDAGRPASKGYHEQLIVVARRPSSTPIQRSYIHTLLVQLLHRHRNIEANICRTGRGSCPRRLKPRLGRKRCQTQKQHRGITPQEQDEEQEEER